MLAWPVNCLRCNRSHSPTSPTCWEVEPYARVVDRGDVGRRKVKAVKLIRKADMETLATDKDGWVAQKMTPSESLRRLCAPRPAGDELAVHKERNGVFEDYNY
jgi:hypothetical protein